MKQRVIFAKTALLEIEFERDEPMSETELSAWARWAWTGASPLDMVLKGQPLLPRWRADLVSLERGTWQVLIGDAPQPQHGAALFREKIRGIADAAGGDYPIFRQCCLDLIAAMDPCEIGELAPMVEAIRYPENENPDAILIKIGAEKG